MKATDLIDNDSIRDDIPDFQAGDELKVHVRVVEGTRATVARVDFEGVQALDERVLRSVLTIAPGQPFSSAAVVAPVHRAIIAPPPPPPVSLAPAAPASRATLIRRSSSPVRVRSSPSSATARSS